MSTSLAKVPRETVGAPLAFAAEDDDLESAFPSLSALMYRLSGVALSDRKMGLVRARLAKRLRALALPGFRAYLELVDSPDGREEQATMVDLLTTNKTSFFREAAHFEFLRDQVVPALAAPRMRIWSAGCSSGEEPYTLAAVLLDALPREADLRILATDISSRVLRRARQGEYSAATLRDVPERYRTTLSASPRIGEGSRWRVRPEVKAAVTLARLNLLGSWPMQGPFDAIFCRNVMIYFDTPTRERLVQRFAALLAPGGHLFVGHSESLHALSHPLRYVRPAVHVR